MKILNETWLNAVELKVKLRRSAAVAMTAPKICALHYSHKVTSVRQGAMDYVLCCPLVADLLATLFLWDVDSQNFKVVRE